MDVDVKNENMDKPAFSTNYQTVEPNNENYQIYDRNKSQEYLETNGKEKEDKSSCCLINVYKYIYSNFLESRQVSPFALTIFTIIGIVINVMVFISSLIYSSIDLNQKTPYFYELMKNWGSGPFTMNIVSDKNIITNLEWYNFKRWEGTNFKLSNFNTNYNLTLYNSINKRGIKCGKDSIGNDLYFNGNDCPINDIIINEQSTYINNGITYNTIALNHNKYFHYTNKNINGNIYVQILIKGEKNVCENNVFENTKDICHYMDNCYVNNTLYNKSDCFQLDLYEQIDTMNYGDFLSDNNLIVENENYLDSDKVSLNARGWIGIDPDYISYLNRTINYYEDIEVEYKWQLGLTIISILKTVFITLNNHFEWIKPWNMVLLGVNIVITFVIFAIEITKKQEVVKAVRAYYYLYNYIYKNLDADYPPIQNKTFVEFYYIVLEIGYIVKLVSEICSWIDYFKFCDKCGCKCENCQDRNCVKCKGEMCVIKGVDCSCKNEKGEKCEKCKKGDCFLCEGYGRRKCANIFLKERCAIYLKHSEKGWKSFKIITCALILFIIFVISYIIIFIVKDDQLSFVD